MDETASDDALAIRARRDTEAFSVLYRRHLQRVYSYLLSRVGNVHDAQDLTAQTFMAALDAIPNYRAQGQFVAWLLRIAKHKLHDHFRAEMPHVDIDAVEALHKANSLEDDVIRRLRMQEIVVILDKLNPDRAEAIRLRYFADLKLREVAAVMDKGESAVKMLVARGLDDIRQILGVERQTP